MSIQTISSPNPSCEYLLSWLGPLRTIIGDFYSLITFYFRIDSSYLNGIADNVIDAESLYLPQNLSDHCPIYCHIKVDGLCTRRQETLIATNRPSWIASHEQRTCFQLKLKIALESTNS